MDRISSAVKSPPFLTTYNFHDFGQSKKKVLLGPNTNVISGIAAFWDDQKERDGMRVLEGGHAAPVRVAQRERPPKSEEYDIGRLAPGLSHHLHQGYHFDHPRISSDRFMDSRRSDGSQIQVMGIE